MAKKPSLILGVQEKPWVSNCIVQRYFLSNDDKSALCAHCKCTELNCISLSYFLYKKVLLCSKHGLVVHQRVIFEWILCCELLANCSHQRAMDCRQSEDDVQPVLQKKSASQMATSETSDGAVHDIKTVMSFSCCASFLRLHEARLAVRDKT